MWINVPKGNDMICSSSFCCIISFLLLLSSGSGCCWVHTLAHRMRCSFKTLYYTFSFKLYLIISNAGRHLYQAGHNPSFGTLLSLLHAGEFSTVLCKSEKSSNTNYPIYSTAVKTEISLICSVGSTRELKLFMSHIKK